MSLKGGETACWELIISMKNGERLSLEQIRTFLAASEEFRFEANNREELYGWVTRTLVEQEYGGQKREAKGLLRRYVRKMTGLSRAQVTRLIGQYLESGVVKERNYRRNRFVKRYQAADVKMLAEVDEAHETLSGPATQKILHREFHDYGNERYQRLAGISAPHIYNLRKSRMYREKKITFQKTRPVKVSIGERRRPDPQGRPGYLRIDTVHQGDLEGIKGVYHINAVDEVTQWQVIGAAAYISEVWLIPVLEAMLRQFPFRILGFHSDNGSEFINRMVAGMLQRLLIEQTKSRPRQSNDNGLVETKNGAVIRKHLGYGSIDTAHAERLQQFYSAHFNPYLNSHRPCAQPDVEIDEKGRQQRVYRRYQTPLETLLALPQAQQYLRSGLTLAVLQRIAGIRSDTEAAQRMQQAKRKLFEQLRPSARGPWK